MYIINMPSSGAEQRGCIGWKLHHRLKLLSTSELTLYELVIGLILQTYFYKYKGNSRIYMDVFVDKVFKTNWNIP